MDTTDNVPMPLFVPPLNDIAGPVIGFFGQTGTTRPGTYSWGYATQDRALAAYTPNSQAGAYVGGLLDLLQAARLADLNTLRVAVENQRLFTESMAKQHNALANDLMNMGLISGA